MFGLGILAVACCALCNGAAAILQKIGANSQAEVDSLDARLLLRLAKNVPYIAGVALDLLGWILTVFAVRHIPLFLAEAVIASSVAVTALLERLVLKRPLRRGTAISIGVIFAGLALVGSSATSEHAARVHGALAWSIGLAPVVCLLVGAGAARMRGAHSAMGLAVIGGLAFGGTSVVGRVLPFNDAWWQLPAQPLFWSLALYGLAGIWLFTLALQRGSATAVNAGMTAAQTIIPAVVGLALLGDHVRAGLWVVMVLGLLCAVAGSVGVTLASVDE